MEAARCAAESGRNYLNDLVGSMAKEIHEIHKQQIESRIMLTSPSHWGDALKTSSWWSSRRAQQQQQQQEMLEQRLVGHGLMCLEELVQPTLINLAENLHARTDVAWGSTAEMTDDNRFSAALAVAEPSEFPGTLCLSQMEADE